MCFQTHGEGQRILLLPHMCPPLNWFLLSYHCFLTFVYHIPSRSSTPLLILGSSHFLIHLIEDIVVATHSGKQTPSEGQCRLWSGLYYTSGPKAESPLSQGP